MKHLSLLTILFIAVFLCLMLSVVSAEPVLTAYTYTADFESGSVGAWSSYPPAQDTAYDPSIWVKPLKSEEAPNRSLYREITPNYEIDYIFGVRKKVDMYVDASSVLTFKSYIKSNRDIDGVRVLFGFADGSSVERSVPFSSRRTWRDCTVKLSDILNGDEIRKLDAVAFMALCPNADPENLLRFGIDDVSINGMREARWEFSSPSVHKLDEWRDFIAATHFEEGGNVTISGSPPFNAGSAAIKVSRALTGENEKHFRMRASRSDGSWSVTIPLTVRSGITSGMWRATIMTSSKEVKNESVTTSLVFLVKAKDAPTDNPRILMASGDADKLMEKASSGRMKKIWSSLEQRAKSNRERYDYNDFNYNLDAYDAKYWLPTYGGYIQAIGTPSGYIRSNGVVYGVSGDEEAGEAARQGLLKMAEWPSFVHPHILNQGQFTYWPVGQKLTDMAIGFDMSADRFDDEERKKIAQALYSKGITEVFKEYVRDNRVSSNTSNWIGDVTGGGLLCALAVMNDYSPEDLEPYMTGMILKMNELIMGCFDQDGGYGEGYSYLRHAMQDMNIAVPAIERTFGVHFPDKLYRCLDFVLYHWESESGAIYDFGDTSYGVGNFSNYSSLITKSRNPYHKWMYELKPGTSDVDFFFMDDSIEAKNPDDLPTVKLFRDIGTAVFRSGFGKDAFTFIYRCGPFYNHQHFDQGAFYLVDGGEIFLGEVGRSDYYNDPWYQKMVIQPGGHNSILVNGNFESQLAGDLLHDVPAWNKYARISDFMDFYGGGFASGRLDPLYKDKLEYLRRSVLYVEPRTVVLIDEVIGTPESKTVDLLFHAPRKDDIAIDGDTSSIDRPAGQLSIKTIAPDGAMSEVKKRPLTIYEFGNENALKMKARGYLQQSQRLDGGDNSTTFINVLSTDGDAISGLNGSSGTGHTALSLGGRNYFINTETGAPTGAVYTEGAVSTDALVYAATDDGYLAMRATTLALNGEKLFSADKPLSLVFSDGSVMMVSYSAHLSTMLKFKLSVKPKLVSIDGEKYRDWKYTKKDGLSINLPEGNHVIGIR